MSPLGDNVEPHVHHSPGQTGFFIRLRKQFDFNLPDAPSPFIYNNARQPLFSVG